MPSVALTRAMPDPARFAGSTEPIRLMPSGIAAAETPVMARPTIIAPIEPASAQTTEPTTSAAVATSSIRRLP